MTHTRVCKRIHIFQVLLFSPPWESVPDIYVWMLNYIFYIYSWLLQAETKVVLSLKQHESRETGRICFSISNWETGIHQKCSKKVILLDGWESTWLHYYGQIQNSKASSSVYRSLEMWTWTRTVQTLVRMQSVWNNHLRLCAKQMGLQILRNR